MLSENGKRWAFASLKAGISMVKDFWKSQPRHINALTHHIGQELRTMASNNTNHQVSSFFFFCIFLLFEWAVGHLNSALGGESIPQLAIEHLFYESRLRDRGLPLPIVRLLSGTIITDVDVCNGPNGPQSVLPRQRGRRRRRGWRRRRKRGGRRRGQQRLWQRWLAGWGLRPLRRRRKRRRGVGEDGLGVNVLGRMVQWKSSAEAYSPRISAFSSLSNVPAKIHWCRHSSSVSPSTSA